MYQCDDGTEWWSGPRGADDRIDVLRRLYGLIESRIPDGSGKSAIDLGCGEGKVTGILLSKGYEVTAVDKDRDVLMRVEEKFPDVRTVCADINHLDRFPDIGSGYDLTTMVYTAQHIEPASLYRVLKAISQISGRLIVEFANSRSIYRHWVNLRRFPVKPSVYAVSPREIDMIMHLAYWKKTYEHGIGLMMPMSLGQDYRWPIVPRWLVNAVNRFEDRFARWCHLYYVEVSCDR